MASLSAFPDLKPGTFEALILIVSPVRGLRPFLAARLRTEKVPKPTSVTESPFLSAFVIAVIALSMARPAAAFDMSAEFATASISSALFIILLPLVCSPVCDECDGRRWLILIHRLGNSVAALYQAVRLASRSTRCILEKIPAGKLSRAVAVRAAPCKTYTQYPNPATE